MVTILGWLLMVTCILAAVAALVGWVYAMGVFAVAPRREARRALTAARHAALPPVKVIRTQIVNERKALP